MLVPDQILEVLYKRDRVLREYKELNSIIDKFLDSNGISTEIEKKQSNILCHLKSDIAIKSYGQLLVAMSDKRSESRGK